MRQSILGTSTSHKRAVVVSVFSVICEPDTNTNEEAAYNSNCSNNHSGYWKQDSTVHDVKTLETPSAATVIKLDAELSAFRKQGASTRSFLLAFSSVDINIAVWAVSRRLRRLRAVWAVFAPSGPATRRLRRLGI